LHHAGHGPVVLRAALPDTTRRLERSPGGLFLLDSQPGARLDGLLQSVPARHPPARGFRGERLLARPVDRVLPDAPLPPMAAATGRRALYCRRRAGGLFDGQVGVAPAAAARAGTRGRPIPGEPVVPRGRVGKQGRWRGHAGGGALMNVTDALLSPPTDLEVYL